MAVPGDERLRCRVCEGFLSLPQKATAANYGVVENKYGCAVRKCMNEECNQFYVCYMQELPDFKTKIILKFIDKPS